MTQGDKASENRKSPTWYLVAWSRRGTAIALNLLLASQVLPTTAIAEHFKARANHLATILTLPSGQELLIIAGLIWYAFLTQLKIRWVLFLPFYLLLMPVTWLIIKAGATALKPIFKGIQQFANHDLSTGTAQKAMTKKRGLSFKRLWVLLFFIWLLALRGLQAAWAVWLLPFLVVPLWLWALRLAYKSAVSPRAIANFAIMIAQHLLDTTIKTLNEAKTKRQEPAGAASRYFTACAQYVLDRYQPEKTLEAIQREAIIIFSTALVLALTWSAAFWGLIGRGLYRTAPTALGGYTFFKSGGWVECCLWAIGVMTTAIAFPGINAPVWLKAIHAGILITGIFQLTYLLACFSIMASTQAERTVQKADEGIRAALAKMAEAKRLQEELTRLIEATTQPPPDEPPKPEPPAKT